MTRDHSVTIAFVIPVRNDAARLRRCLESIAHNRYPRAAVEVVVVDNASTDGSGDVARAFADAVITVSGTSVAALRNRGARETRAPLIAFVDADHEIHADWIAAAVTSLADGHVGAAGFPYDTQPNANWVQRLYDAMRRRPLSRETVSWLGSGNLVVRRACFDAVGGFCEQLIACEDVDLCNRLIQAGYAIVADPGMRSTHYGDPRTVRALFLGELWRGRDNLRVTFRGPRTLPHLRSALIPIVDLLCIVGAVVALISGYPLIALSLGVVPFAVAMLRAVVLYKRRQQGGPLAGAEAMLMAVVFDLARALALVIPGSHRARRA